MLRFSCANVKLVKTAKLLGVKADRRNLDRTEFCGFSLLAGHDCPNAKDCRSCAVEYTDGSRGVEDGPYTQYRCYAATAQARLRGVYDMHAANSEAIRAVIIRGVKATADLIDNALPQHIRVVRIHPGGGDFFCATYLKAWLEVARRRPNCLFYVYTKALPLLKRYVQQYPRGVDLSRGILSHNFMVTASRGGTHDHLIEGLDIREAQVIYHPRESGSMPIDSDDTHAALPGGSFCLLIHGTQPAGTPASVAWEAIRTDKVAA